MLDPLTLVRGLHFAATLLASGTVSFIGLIALHAVAVKMPADVIILRGRLTVVIWLALAAAILSGAAWLVLLASDILGASFADVCLHGGAWPILVDTRFGMVWCVRFILAVLLALLVFVRAARSVQIAVASGFVALPALVGHAGATPGMAGNIHLVSDMMHLLAAGAWLGGLPAFVLSLWQAQRAASPPWRNFAVQATHRFSVLGILSVGILLASGLTNSWYLLSGPRDLVTSDYGRLVTLKIGLFAAMVAIATVNRFYLTPRLPEPAALRALQRNGLTEVGLGLIVLMFVGMLGTLPPAAHVHTAPADVPSGAAFVHIHAPEGMAEVTIDPGRAGIAEVTIRVLREDFSRFPAKEVRLTLEPPTSVSRRLEKSAIQQSDGSWRVNDITLVEPGIWTVRVIVTPDKGDAIPLDAPIVIER